MHCRALAGSTAFDTTACLPTGNAPRTWSKPENSSASKPLKTPTTTTPLRPTGCSVPLVALPCASSKSSRPLTHRALHHTEDATPHDLDAFSLNTKRAVRPPILNRQRHRVAPPRVTTAQMDRFRSAMSANAPTSLPVTPFSTATRGICSRSHQPGPPRRAQIPIAQCRRCRRRFSSAVSFLEPCQTPAGQPRRTPNVTAARQASDNP